MSRKRQARLVEVNRFDALHGTNSIKVRSDWFFYTIYLWLCRLCRICLSKLYVTRKVCFDIANVDPGFLRAYPVQRLAIYYAHSSLRSSNYRTVQIHTHLHLHLIGADTLLPAFLKLLLRPSLGLIDPSIVGAVGNLLLDDALE